MGLSKEEATKKIQESDSKEFNVLTPDEEVTLLENFAKSEVEKRIGDEVSKIHTKYDDDIYEITGKRKSGDVKTYAFLKEQLSELKTKAASNSELNLKIKDLEQKIKDGKGSEEAQRELKSVKDTYKEEKKLWETEKQSLVDGNELDKILGSLDRSAVGLKFKSEDLIPKDVRDIMITNAKTKISKNGSFIEGKLVFMKEGTQEIMRNKNNGLEPYTAEELLAEELKSIIDTGKKQGGPGVGEKPEIKGEGKDADIFVAEAENAKTKVELSTLLLKQGLTRGSKEYDLAYKKYSEKLPMK